MSVENQKGDGRLLPGSVLSTNSDGIGANKSIDWQGEATIAE